MSAPLGTLPFERLALLPKRHWAAHEFSFFIHDQLARLLVEFEGAGVHAQVADVFRELLAERGLNPDDFDLIEFLRNAQTDEFYKRHLLGNLVLALTGDFCHFIYESLTTFEKRKFAVGFSLLRKPFKENLLFLCWILGSRDEFISRFEKDNYQTLNNISKEKQLEIFRRAIEALPFKDAFEPETLWSLIYSKNNAEGFEHAWQKATHLITSKGDLLKTEDYGINFIFHDPSDDRLYDLLYLNLPYILMFCLQVILECFSALQRINENTYGHLLFSALGSYESIFVKKKSRIGTLLNKELKLFLKCVHCKAALRITKKNGAKLYLTEQMDCARCGLPSPFPLFWLFATANMKIIRENNG